MLLMLYLASKSKFFHDIFNVGTGKPTSVNFIAIKLGGKVYSKRPGEPQKSQANIKKIQKNLKWYPKINMKMELK